VSHPSKDGPDNVRPVRVLTVPAARPIAVRFLAGYRGMLTHWHAGRSRACLGEPSCPQNRHKALTIWKGYAPAEWWDTTAEHWTPCVLEVTEGIEERFRGRRLRGEGWLLSRANSKDPQSEVVGMFAEEYDPKQLRPAFDMMPVLARMYHDASWPFDVPNPIPPRLMLASESGTAPNLLKELTAADPKDRMPTDQEMRDFRQRFREMGTGKRAADSASATKGSPGTHGRNGKEQPL
jgi:hypothetical protein